MLFPKSLLAFLIGSSVFLTACNDSKTVYYQPPTDHPNEPPPIEPPDPEPVEPTIQTEANLISEKANIAIFGPVEKVYFSETTLQSGQSVLLLDDNDLNSVGFALSTGNTTNLTEFSRVQLSNFIQLLQNNGATVNVLVNKPSQNTQGDVVNVTLDVNFNTAENLSRIREILLRSLNEDQALNLPSTVTAQEMPLTHIFLAQEKMTQKPHHLWGFYIAENPCV